MSENEEIDLWYLIVNTKIIRENGFAYVLWNDRLRTDIRIAFEVEEPNIQIKNLIEEGFLLQQDDKLYIAIDGKKVTFN